MKTLERRLEEAQERASLNANQVTGTERFRKTLYFIAIVLSNTIKLKRKI